MFVTSKCYFFRWWLLSSVCHAPKSSCSVWPSVTTPPDSLLRCQTMSCQQVSWHNRSVQFTTVAITRCWVVVTLTIWKIEASLWWVKRVFLFDLHDNENDISVFRNRLISPQTKKHMMWSGEERHGAPLYSRVIILSLLSIERNTDKTPLILSSTLLN